MIIPHLMFAHMLGDYVLQSNWLVARKIKSWDGLVLHGGVVGFMSLIALAPYLDTLWPPVLGLFVLHTIQDYVKIYSGPRLRIHSFVPYAGDQVLHVVTIAGIQLWAEPRLAAPPSAAEIAFMWTGAAVIAVTRFYDVTWWANWLDMLPYMTRWRVMGYLERIAMLALAAAGTWYAAPWCALPRLFVAWRRGQPIWQQRRGILELGLGMVLSVALGSGLHAVYATL